MECASATVKKIFLELGGKSANIVLDDAPLEAVLPGAAMTCVHGGQGCAITTRLLVPRVALRRGAAPSSSRPSRAGATAIPPNPSNLQGPQVSKRQQERVLAYIEKGKRDGARCLVGGGKPAGALGERGCFVEPTLFVDVDPTSTIAQEEIFGPVLVRDPVRDDDDAVRIANDSDYGLSGAIQTSDVERGIARGAPHPHRHASRWTGASGSTSTRPSEATSRAASAARTASWASRSTSKPR